MIPSYAKTKHFAATRAELNSLRLSIPRWDSAIQRAEAVATEQWDNLQHMPMLPHHLFTVWWRDFDGKHLQPRKIEQQFWIFQRRLLRQLEDQVARRRELTTVEQIPSKTLANLRESLSYPNFRVTRRLLEFIDETDHR